jgi:peroxiredoxin
MPFNLLVATLIGSYQLPTLSEIETKVSAYPGVQIEAEMRSPSVVPMSFRISPEGLFWAKYPTSEMFVSPAETLTWMPERKEYVQTKNSEGNPCPLGFHSLWPSKSGGYKQLGDATETDFLGRKSYCLTIQGEQPYQVQLFVDQTSRIPIGTRVMHNGTLYEMYYKDVKVGKVAKSLLTFKPPKGAKVAGPQRPDASLIKPGSKLSTFSGTALDGKKLALKSLLKTHAKGLVLNFWFSSCVGCVQEMPYLVKLHPKLLKQGIGIIGVNPIDDSKSAHGTSKRNSLGYPTLIGNGAISLQKQVSVEAYPVTVIVDPKSSVIDAFMGFDETRLRRAIAKIGGRI